MSTTTRLLRLIAGAAHYSKNDLAHYLRAVSQRRPSPFSELQAGGGSSGVNKADPSQILTRLSINVPSTQIRTADTEAVLIHPKDGEVNSRGHVESAGEDAWALLVQRQLPSANAPTTGTEAEKSRLLLAVADGVGGWRDQGIDPSLFPYRLLEHAVGIASNTGAEGIAHTPKDLLTEAFTRMKFDEDRAIGSSTATIVSLDSKEGTMTTAQLGDSIYAILRQVKYPAEIITDVDQEESLTSSSTTTQSIDKTTSDLLATQEQQTPIEPLQTDGSTANRDHYAAAFQAPEQQHYFNCPYQLTLLPRSQDDQMNRGRWDSPNDAVVREHQLYPNDIVVVATDGFSDNLGTIEMEAIVNSWAAHERNAMKKSNNKNIAMDAAAAGRLAAMLVSKAVALSLDTKRASPFAQRAKEAGQRYRGGKPDDVTVLVAIVEDQLAAESDIADVVTKSKL